MIKLYLFDIEGTTTDINFVHKVLFPYSYERMENFVLQHQTHPVVSKALAQVRETLALEQGRQLGLYEVIDQLKAWIKEDRKHPALKDIQGLIWDTGYTQNHFKGHVYDDVLAFFSIIVSTGAKISIYSSGSIHAQKLIFGYSKLGDLTPFISYYFDTTVGPKRDPQSYLRIAQQTQLAPQEIHFFSDVREELLAALSQGYQVHQVLRDGCQSSELPCISNFAVLQSHL